MRPRITDFLSLSPWPWLAGLVPTAGAVYILVFAVLAVLFIRRTRQAGLLPGRALEAVAAAALGGAIGTRAFFLVTTGQLWHLSPLAILDASRGTASWGAYVGAALGLLVYGSLAGADPLRLLDTAASVTPLGDVLGRWSCFLAGDDFGRVTDLPWAIRFPKGSLAWDAHVARGALASTADFSLPVHPFQFYLMANAAVLYCVTTVIWRRHRQDPGVTLATFLVLYGATRFWWEFLRDPAAGGAAGTLSVSQWTCLAFAGGGALLLRLRPPTPT